MTTAKTNTTDGMKYVETGKKTINPKHGMIRIAEDLSTGRLLWILVKRHKVALLATGNVILVLNWMVPQWPQIVRSLIG